MVLGAGLLFFGSFVSRANKAETPLKDPSYNCGTFKAYGNILTCRNACKDCVIEVQKQ